MDAFGEHVNKLMQDTMIPPYGSTMATKVAMALFARNILQDKARVETEGEPAPAEFLMSDIERTLIKHTVNALFSQGMFYMFMAQLSTIMDTSPEEEPQTEEEIEQVQAAYINAIGVLWCETMDKAMRIGFSVGNQIAAWDGSVKVADNDR